jgi:hypothetical protein
MLLTMARCCPDDGSIESSQMNNPSDKKNRVYVLRLWRAEEPDQGWRASLEDPHTGERIGFASLECLFAFLMEQVEGDAKGLKGR